MPRPDQLAGRLATGLLLAGAALLALEPAGWLVGTWRQEGYDGIGWLACLLAAGMFVWSGSSPLRVTTPASNLPTYALLLGTAGIRLVAQLLDVNVIGALLLGVDVYALARLARLADRSRAASPFWLAALFCFSLPIEPMLQRVLGYGLQQISAFLACGLLAPVFDSLSCSGVRLQVEGRDVLVDLPCSGAELLSITALTFALFNTIHRPTVRAGIVGILICLVLALLGNASRIALLAAGIAKADHLPFQVMDPTPHTLIGLATVSLTCLAMLTMTRRLPVAVAPHVNTRQTPIIGSGVAPQAVTRVRHPWTRLVFACGFSSFALLVGTLQPQPVDNSSRLSSPPVPRVAAGLFSTVSPLSELEKAYFTRYGGDATRASFGPFGLLLVSTASPLRHLHDPTICLSGMGYSVRLLGTDHNTHSTVYVAQKDADESYTVRVSYRSDAGVVASSIAEVVWRWLQAPDSQWTMVQRVVPDHPAISSETAHQWESAMRRAFNLS